jgi:hypothetical protein
MLVFTLRTVDDEDEDKGWLLLYTSFLTGIKLLVLKCLNFEFFPMPRSAE